jgi:hypothetical protein
MPEDSHHGYAHDPLFPGEHITCDNGHQIGTVTRRCVPGRESTNWIECIIWDQAKPDTGGPCTCVKCGANWILIKIYGDGTKAAYLCVDGEWRPDLEADALRYLGKAVPGPTLWVER